MQTGSDSGAGKTTPIMTPSSVPKQRKRHQDTFATSADNNLTTPTFEISDAMGQEHQEETQSDKGSTSAASSELMYDHRHQTGMNLERGRSHRIAGSSSRRGGGFGHQSEIPETSLRKRMSDMHMLSGAHHGQQGLSPPRGVYPDNRRGLPKYGSTRQSLAATQYTPGFSLDYGSPGNHQNFHKKPEYRRRAYSEVDRQTASFRPPLFDPNFSAFDEDDDDVLQGANSVYIPSNPSSRRSSASSSIDDVCFPVDSIDDSGKRKVWPDIEVLEEFSREELEEVRKIDAASAALSQDTSEGVNFEYPLVSNVDQGESLLTEPLMQSKEDETSLIDGRLRPPKLSPWDRRRHDGYRAKQTMLGKFRFTYFREDLTETIHSPSISGLVHSDGSSFADLFSPSVYASKQKLKHTKSSTSGTPNFGPAAASTATNNGSVPVLPKGAVASSTTTSIPSLGDYSQDINPFWLDVCNPTEDEMKAISKTFGIHPLTTEDIFLGETREKVELFRDYYFVCFSSFDVAQEHHRQKVIEKAHALSVKDEESAGRWKKGNLFQRIGETTGLLRRRRGYGDTNSSLGTRSMKRSTASITSRRATRLSRQEELVPVNMYIIVFRYGVITFHFQPTPHPGNVRRRARLLRDYLTVTSDWIGYALIDDITDAFAPLIDSIEKEVNLIEDEILVMQSGDHADSDDSSDESDDEDRVWVKLKRRASTVGDSESQRSYGSAASSSSSTSSSSSSTKVISWKRKGDMLRRIGECRRRVMSLLRLLGSKPDVIKGFAKRCNEEWDVAPKSEIGLYLGDIQDHVVTMIQALNHYEKVLARSHSNYLAQINIDMTKVNNDMNDILGKITILGTMVLPLNIVTGLWGMNCLVPGQSVDNLNWFWGILSCMIVFSVVSCLYATRVIGVV